MYNDNNKGNQKPIGDRIREFLDGPLNDPDKKAIQLQMLDDVFNEAADALPKVIQAQFQDIFNKAANIEHPEDRNYFIIEAITTSGKKGYSPVLPLGLPISTEFTEFTWNDVHELKGYIKLHEVARECNFAINVENLVEKGPNGAAIPPRMTIYCNKSYQEGVLLYPSVYPHLPEKKEEPVKAKPDKGKFHFPG